MKPVLQLALDFVDLRRALKVAREAVEGGVDWLEAGTPLIKSEGLDAVRALRKEFLKHTIVADMKVMDAGRVEVESAAKAGANIVDVLGAASDATIRECIEAGKNYGAEIIVDTIAIDQVVERATEIEAMGANYVSVHIAIDEQMLGVKPFDKLTKVVQAVHIPVAVAGGINSETAAAAVKAGAAIIIVGGAISKARDAKKAAQEMKKAIRTKTRIKSDLYKRVSLPDIRKVLEKVSTPNLSDAMHRGGDLRDIRPITQGLKMVGPAVTVRTYPGDWAKPVEAIDAANEGEVIVIDAGGAGPAVWGELATHSSLQKRLAGVVIDGAIRDTIEVRELRFPAFAKLIMPTAGEPKGFGEIGVPVRVGGVRVGPGDWLVGDDDGVIAIPKEKAVEFTNRAMDVLEKENRIRKEIQEGGTLSSVTELLRWEKH
ncbi:orotidine 5'-phosphate decarboxylase [candidate division NPL-UPA2 bacterium]|nr:orotidine 5'-phosphate decarboxylase [candidate division NPL-UPA2 bacterium]